MYQFRTALHIYRRDLRVQDNSSLNKALESAETVLPCFIFDDRQLLQNSYKSEKAFDFMTESLRDLKEQIDSVSGRLYFFSGIAEQTVERLIKELKIDAVFINKDYTPFSRARDTAIKIVCDKYGVVFKQHEDALINSPEAVLKDNGRPYSVFTAYYKRASLMTALRSQKLSPGKFFKGYVAGEKKIEEYLNPHRRKAGRGEALKLQRRIRKLTKYEQDRDIPAVEGTTFLSPHNKFGTVSIREVYETIISELGNQSVLIKQLYWRDFFTHIVYHYPYVFGEPFRSKYQNIEWTNDKKLYTKWSRGVTGFPIVDAGMRQLNKTGWMHNRVRMITASFLVKDLHIDWRWGEKYFAQHLVDYDPAVNNGNWQWAASTGCDAQPYFRIFNPWLQQKRHDPQCRYVKTWVPEIKNIPDNNIHKLENPDIERGLYPLPIVDHRNAVAYTKMMFKTAARQFSM